MSDALDEALARLHRTDVEFASGRTDGLSNHGPMAAESLVELGGEARVMPFVLQYERRLRPLPARDGRPPVLGDPTTVMAFLDRYETALAVADPLPPLRAALDELMPAAVSGAAHGLLRTAHATRALLARDVPVRRREVAFALASWAIRHQRIPGAPGSSPIEGLDVVSALLRVPLLPVAARVDAGLIVDRVAQVAEVPGFAEAVAAVDLDAMPMANAISSLAAAAARLFVRTPDARFVYLHALTGTSALRMLAPLLDEAASRRALGAVFHAVAALHATYGHESSLRALDEPIATEGCLDREALRARALATDDDHDVKMIAAALREHAIDPRPEFLAAASIRVAR